jgi:hypothetical protein
MKKLTIADILVPGAKLIARKIDINDPEVRAHIERVREEQRKIKYRIDHFDRKQLEKVVKTPQLRSFLYFCNKLDSCASLILAHRIKLSIQSYS